MKSRLSAAAAIFLSVGVSASGHRLDEYLQATIISVENDRIQAFMRLTPGIAVYATVLASIDTNSDAVISETEQRAYAQRVLGDLSLSVDDRRLKPRLSSVNFPPAEEMREGLGEIHIEFSADLPRTGTNRKLVFENHHQSRIAAYLVNCLIPRDRNIQFLAQKRNENQSFYQLDYEQRGSSYAPSPQYTVKGRAWLGSVVLIICAGLVLVWRQRMVDL